MKNKQLQEWVNRAAIIARKYGIDEYYVRVKFSFLARSSLESAFKLANKEIQNREIIKDTHRRISSAASGRARAIAKGIGEDEEELYRFLLSRFDPASLKLSEEDLQRRARQIAAYTYLDKASSAARRIKLNESRRAESIQQWIVTIGFSLLVISAIAYLAVPRIIDGLTQPDILYERYVRDSYPSIGSQPITEGNLSFVIREETRYKTNGSICRDGWVSKSTGRGTCSWHKGVARRYSEGDYSLTLEEATDKARTVLGEFRHKAVEVSWRE